MDHCQNEETYSFWQNVFASKLQDARSMSPRECEEAREIQVVRENDAAVISGPIEDFAVTRFGITHIRPMKGVKSMLAEEL